MTVIPTPKPTIIGEASWSSFPTGLFVIGTSLLDGPDTLAATPYDDSFSGPYDVLDVRRYSVEQGKSAPLAEVEAGTCTVDISDPDGLLNPENAASPIAATLDDRLHPFRLRKRFDGVGGEFTVTGSPTFNADGSATIDSPDYISGPAKYNAAQTGWEALLLDDVVGGVMMLFEPSWAAGSAGDRYLFFWGSANAITFAPQAYYGLLHGAGANYLHAARSEFVGTDFAIGNGGLWNAGDKIFAVIAWTPTRLKMGYTVVGRAYSPLSDVASSHRPPKPPSTFSIGSINGLAAYASADVHWMAGFRGDLTDAVASRVYDLVSERDRWPSELPREVAPTFVWPADSAAYITPDVEKGLFSGWIRTAQWEPQGRRGTAQLECIDLFYWLERAKPVITATGPTTIGAALGLILDSIGFTDPNLRALDRGDDIPNFIAAGDKNGLELVSALMEISFGRFFIDGDGVATFLDRTTVRGGPVVATVRDRMVTVAPGIDVDYVKTKAKVTRTGGLPQTSENLEAGRRWATSEGPEIESPYLFDDRRAKDIADYLVSVSGQPKAPVRPITLQNVDADILGAMLEVEQGQRLRLSESRGGTDGEFYLERRSLSGEGSRHRADWIVSRAPTEALFRLDVSLLDGAHVLAF